MTCTDSELCDLRLSTVGLTSHICQKEENPNVTSPLNDREGLVHQRTSYTPSYISSFPRTSGYLNGMQMNCTKWQTRAGSFT